MAPFDIEPLVEDEPSSLLRKHARTLGAIFVLSVVFACYLFIVPPARFPTGQLIELPEDASVGEMAAVLKQEGAVRSAFLFKVYARVTLQDRTLASGLYLFDRPLGLMGVVHRMATNRHGIVPHRVTLTEGMTVEDMARRLEAELPGFDGAAFRELASTSEGYLFPDTYFFMPQASPEETYARLASRFDERVESVRAEIEGSGRDIEDLVIMASLLEREAKTLEDKRVIAGILWTRLENDMPLQVDAVFGYMRGENGYEPTAEDLETESPYNTYLNTGLPPTPIANPGLESLLAAAQPEESEYVYYLTGRDGLMRYGRTFAEHKRNRELYLD
jgi:UPF0755 protein